VTEASMPLLHFHAGFGLVNDHGLFELDDTQYQLRGVALSSLQAVVARLEGRRSVADISRDAAITLPLVLTIVQQLMDLALVVDLCNAPSGDVTPAQWTTICRQLFPRWKEHVFSHPLWQMLATGEASSSQFAGWLLESYHFIEGVNVRLPMVIAECADVRVRHHFVRHYTEEYDHHHFFMQALNALGIDSTAVQASRPLPGTLAVLNWMRYCGRQDPLYYAACSGFLESTGSDREKARQFYQLLTEHYDRQLVGIVEPMAAHVALDEAYGHAGFLEKVCGELGAVPQQRANAALQAVAGLVETLELWATDILRHYAEPAALPCKGVRRYRPARRSSSASFSGRPWL